MDDTAYFTFEGMLTYWKHFGSFFTIVDSKFLKYENRQSGLILYGIVGGLFLPAILYVGLMEMQMDADWIMKFVLLPLVIIFAISFVWYSLKRVDII